MLKIVLLFHIRGVTPPLNGFMPPFDIGSSPPGGYECYDGRQPAARHKWKEAAALSRVLASSSVPLSTQKV